MKYIEYKINLLSGLVILTFYFNQYINYNSIFRKGQNMKTTVFVFHSFLDNGSRVNKKMAELAKESGFEVRDMYKIYPDFNIDEEKEQAILEETDRIVLQFPIQWYQTPALLKEWFDKVFVYGWAYGSQGKALQGKEIILAVSFGASADAYTPDGKYHTTTQEVLRPIFTIQYLTGLIYLDSFTTLGTLNLDDEEIKKQAERYVEYISK